MQKKHVIASILFLIGVAVLIHQYSFNHVLFDVSDFHHETVYVALFASALVLVIV